MYAKIFTGSAFLLSFVSVSMAGAPWDANDKALGHQGGTSHYARQSQYNQYRYQPYAAQVNPVLTVRVIPSREITVARPQAQVAQTPNMEGRRSFSIEPSASVPQAVPQVFTPKMVSSRVYQPAPRATHGTARPSWESADTKIRGLEGSVKHN